MKTTTEFMLDIPRTPIYQHVGQIHSILFYMYSRGDSHDVNAVEMAEHSLREIAIASLDMLTPEERYTEMMRRQRVDHPPADLASNMQASIRKAFEGVAQAVERMKAPRLSLTPEQREAIAERKHRRMIEQARLDAKNHLYRESARVRRELADEIHIHVPHNKTGAGQ